MMAGLNVGDVIRELDISRSYLYKLIDKENVLIPRSETGRYFWDENTVETIKRILHIDNLQDKDDTDSLISKLGLKQSFINNRRYLGNKYSLSDFIRKTVDENCKGVNIVIDIFSGLVQLRILLRIKCLSQMICCIVIIFPIMHGLDMKNIQAKR